jgi:hypothetical protein
MLIRTVFLVLVSSLTFWTLTAGAKDDGWETVTVREQHPRVTARYSSALPNTCGTEVVYEVWLNNEVKVNVDSEVCILEKKDVLSTLRKEIGYSAPYLSIRENCMGSDYRCAEARALILISSNAIKKLGTFTDFVHLQDKTLIVSVLITKIDPFIGKADHERLHYISSVKAGQLHYSKDMTWLLNHERFTRHLNFIEICERQRSECRKPWDAKTALLFMAELATVTDRASHLKKTLESAESILSPQDHRNFLKVVRSIEKPKP